MLHAHRGTPYVYQGQELGMINVPWTDLSEFRDLEVLNYVAARAAEGRSFAELLPGISRVNRDNARTPMQWSDEPGAGFTTGEPWLALNPAAREINAAAQVGVAGSVFEFYRELIALRRELPVLVAGDFELLSPALIDAERPTVWAVRRTLEGEKLTALANFSREDVDVPEQWWPAGAEVVLASEDVTAGQLRGWQVVYLRH